MYEALRRAGVEARAFPGELLRHFPHSDEDRTRHYAIKDLWESMAVARAYHRIKFDVVERVGHPLSLAERELLCARVRPAVRSWWAAGRTGELEVSVVVETGKPDGPRKLTYRFEPYTLVVGPVT